MVVTIKVQSTNGVNLNQGASSYLATMPAMFNSSKNLGYFKDSLEDSPQYGVAQSIEDSSGAYTGGASLIAGGSLSYSLQTHVVEGRLASLALGEGLEGVDEGAYLTKQTMTARESVVSFDKLGLDSDKGGDVAGILYGMMTGDEAAFLKFLARSAVKFTGGAGDDVYVGGTKSDMLNGAAGADTLVGGKGNDKLTGGVGADTLSGGAGKDQFIFRTAKDSAPGAFDTLTDFNARQGDKISLKAVDADVSRSGNQAFVFIGEDDFSGKAGELRFETSGTGIDISGDTDGDGAADFLVHLAKAATIAESAILL